MSNSLPGETLLHLLHEAACLKLFDGVSAAAFTTKHSLQKLIVLWLYSMICCIRDRQPVRTTNIMKMSAPKTMNTVTNFPRFGAKGSTPVVLKIFAARAKGKNI